MNWIKCSEKEPPKGQFLIAAMESVVRKRGLVACELYYTSQGTYEMRNGGRIRNEVTHWMPLPDPPAI